MCVCSCVLKMKWFRDFVTVFAFWNCDTRSFVVGFFSVSCVPYSTRHDWRVYRPCMFDIRVRSRVEQLSDELYQIGRNWRRNKKAPASYVSRSLSISTLRHRTLRTNMPKHVHVTSCVQSCWKLSTIKARTEPTSKHTLFGMAFRFTQLPKSLCCCGAITIRLINVCYEIHCALLFFISILRMFYITYMICTVLKFNLA